MGTQRTAIAAPRRVPQNTAVSFDRQKSRKKFSGGFYNMEKLNAVSTRRTTIDATSTRRMNENKKLTKEEILGFLTKVSLNQEPSIDAILSLNQTQHGPETRPHTHQNMKRTSILEDTRQLSPLKSQSRMNNILV